MFYTNDKGYQQILRDAIQYRILRWRLGATKRPAGDSTR